ncbi:MAG: twin-arginine translocation signal domain-containing protein [Candidatus Acidiferrales bacterium]
MARITRRKFLANSASAAAGAIALGASPWPARAWAQTVATGPDLTGFAPPEFTTDNAALDASYRHALKVLASNVTTVLKFPDPVLIEGSVYRGVWLECAPQEGLVYSQIAPALGFANHRVFFETQRDDGYIACDVKPDVLGTGQIQMVVPIAATALDLFETFGDSAFLEDAYESCARWDAWLVRYRNTRGTGLCEGFCTYDTGQDNSPRWKGMPNRCADDDARLCPSAPGLPRLCPDLSATVFGGRVALAKMARILGKNSEADDWDARAAAIRKLILDRLYVPEDACFYDLDSDNKFVRVRGDAMIRVLGEHVVDSTLFEEIYRKQIHNPDAFWAPYPLPSIALDDSSFVRPIPRNSWGGASQALTALRAPRWMEFYGKPADLAHLMDRWVDAIVRSGDFYQQLDPLSGECTKAGDPGGYSPAALVLLDFVWRLYGVRKVGESIEWNCRPPANSAKTVATIKTPRGTAQLQHASDGSALTLAGKPVLRVFGAARIVTDLDGKPTAIAGTSDAAVDVRLVWPNGKHRKIAIAPNATQAI